MKYFALLILVHFVTATNTQVHERWDVKTLTNGYTPNVLSAKRTSVAIIEKTSKVPVRNTQPRLNFEKRVITIRGKITRLILESDGDYHIEISDGSLGDSTIVCEAVNPQAAVNSTCYTYIRSVRNTVTHLSLNENVEFTGMLFQDKYHNPSPNRIRNFLEIHPILKAKKL